MICLALRFKLVLISVMRVDLWQTCAKSLITIYNIGATLAEMLRVRLVCGKCNTALQRHLPAEEGLTFDRAFLCVKHFQQLNGTHGISNWARRKVSLHCINSGGFIPPLWWDKPTPALPTTDGNYN